MKRPSVPTKTGWAKLYDAGCGSLGTARPCAHLTSAGVHAVSVVAMIGALRSSVSQRPTSIIERAEEPGFRVIFEQDDGATRGAWGRCGEYGEYGSAAQHAVTQLSG